MRRPFPLLLGPEFADCVTELGVIAAVRESESVHLAHVDAVRAGRAAARNRTHRRGRGFRPRRDPSR